MKPRARRVLTQVDAAMPTLHDLQLRMNGRADGIASGLHETAVIGAGSDTAEARQYTPGDDPRRIDWSATARTGIVHVRDTIAERDLRVVVVVDGSASMFFGTSELLKHELALGFLAATCRVASRTGDTVGAVISGPGTFRWIPAGAGAEHTAMMTRSVAAMERQTGVVDLADVLRRSANLLAGRRSLVIVLSDFLGELDSVKTQLRGLAGRHTVWCVRCFDDREMVLPNVGLVTLVDPETGALVNVDTSSPNTRKMFETKAGARAVKRVETLRSAGAQVTELKCAPGWERNLGKIVKALS